MGIRNTDKCVFCKDSTDSVDHMLLWCPIITTLWNEVNMWLSEIGFLYYNLSDSRKILGDLDQLSIPSFYLQRKLYMTLSEEKNSSLAHIKNEI